MTSFMTSNRLRVVLALAVCLPAFVGVAALSSAEPASSEPRFELPVYLVAQTDTIPSVGVLDPKISGISAEAMEAAGVPVDIPIEPVELAFSLNRLMVPVAGFEPEDLDDSFYARRSGGRTHQAIDIAADRGTPVVAVSDGSIIRKHTNRLGGNVLYAQSPDGRYAFYYAHLDDYAPGIEVGRTIFQGDTLGYVGNSGNARYTVAHLHFQVIETGGRRPGQLYRGRKLNPYRLFRNSNLYRTRTGLARG
ncbi:MAG: M23 family metallopeptidase [Bacteroidetes bacterium]|nr:M23 family metallopeptidase [Bacteroidota bacterium]